MNKKSFHRLIFKNALPMIIYLLLYIIHTVTAVYYISMIGTGLDVAEGIGESFKSFAFKFAGIAVIVLSTRLIFNLVKNRLREKIQYDIRTALYDAVFRENPSQFSEQPSEHYSSMLVKDISLLERNYVVPLLSSAENFIMIIISLISLLFINVFSAVFAIILSFFSIWLSTLFVKKLQSEMSALSAAQEQYFNTVSDIYSGYDCIRDYEADAYAGHKLCHAGLELVNSEKSANRIGELASQVSSIGSYMVSAFSLVFALILSLRGGMTAGDLFAILYVTINTVSTIQAFSDTFPQVLGAKELIAKYDHVLNTGDEGLTAASFDREIVLKNITLSDGERNILDGISLTIHRGDKISLVGRSGAGKSTLLKLLLKFNENYSGDILYDGVSIRELSCESLYKLSAPVFSNLTLFTGTVRDNVTLLASGYNDTEISDALIQAGLKDFAVSGPEGLDRVISEESSASENTTLLSGGEKQRLLIARALLRKKSILLLDEATSALDRENFIQLENMLLDIPDITIVNITHRYEPEILKRYNTIYVLDNGRNTATGSYNELREIMH